LEERVTLKPIPLVIIQIGVGIKVTLINSITHASENFKTLDIVLKDTSITERAKSQLVPLAKHVDTTSERPIHTIGK
jgi:hypothetical protein